MDERFGLVMVAIIMVLVAAILVVGAYAFWIPIRWTLGNALTPPAGMMGGPMGLRGMMGWCPCMQWMGGAGAVPQQLTVYAGDFGLRPDSIHSPGSELRVRAGSLVKLTVVNVGQAMHVLTVVRELKEDPNAEPVFSGAAAGTPRNPIPPGSSVTIYFVADMVGTYYYVCNIPGHVSLGMWGEFVVTSALTGM